MSVWFKIEGGRELERSIRRLGKVPQKSVTAAAKKAMNIPKKKAVANAPELFGDLKRGIISFGEKSRLKGKKVYSIVFGRAYNDIFQKPVKNPGESGSPKARSTAYYPVSQEYGYYLRDGTYKPGKAFVRDALESSESAIEKSIISSMKKSIDKEIAKGGLRP